MGKSKIWDVFLTQINILGQTIEAVVNKGQETYVATLWIGEKRSICTCENEDYCDHLLAAELFVKAESKGNIRNIFTDSKLIKRLLDQGKIKKEKLAQKKLKQLLTLDEIPQSQQITTGIWSFEQLHLNNDEEINLNQNQNEFFLIPKLQLYKIDSNYWFIDSKYDLCFEFRIAKKGGKKSYAIRNFFKILENFKNKNQELNLRITSFPNPRLIDFESHSRKLLDYLISLKLNLRSLKYNNGNHLPAKYLKVWSNQYGHLLEILQEFPYYDEQLKKHPDQHPITYEKLSPDNSLLAMKVTHYSGGYNLELTNKTDAYLEELSMIVKDQAIYQLDSNQSVLYEHFVELEKEVGDIRLWFRSQELPQLRTIVNYFSPIVKVKTPANFWELNTLKLGLNLQKEADQLVGNIVYQYGDQSYTPLEIILENGLDYDFKEEKKFQLYLQQLGFTGDFAKVTRPFPQNDDLYNFFAIELPNLKKNNIEINLDEEISQLVQYAEDTSSSVAVTEDDGLLSISFSIAGIMEEEVDHVLERLDNNERYYVKKDGGLLVFDQDEEDEITKVANSLAELRSEAKMKDGKIELPASHILNVRNVLKNDHNVSFDQKLTKLVQDLSHPEDFPFVEPQEINAELRDYQKSGLQWLTMLDSYNFGGILADEMGLGKTLQMISFLVGRLQENQKVLIVCPASLIYNWQEEFKKFAPTMLTEVINGTKDERKQLIKGTSANILITSYNSARLDIAVYKKIKFAYLVLDEAQAIKNSSSKTNKALQGLKVKTVFALSGTPVENRVEELWAIFALVLPGLLPAKKDFKQLSASNISTRVKPFILRREKEAVLTQLPEKQEINLYSELTEDQKLVYLAQLKQMQVKVKGMSSETFVKNKLEILAGLTRLRQICDTPALYLDDYPGSSGKLEQLEELMIQAQENGHRALIFSQFTTMLEIVEQKLTKLGISLFKLTGKTKSADRLKMVNAFNEGQNDAFLISLKAGGTGLNLTGADTVILLDLWWNPAVEDQATARAHRFGQTKNVEVWRLITKGTIEEQIYNLQEKKRDLVDQILSGTDNKSTLTEEEVRAILGLNE